MSLCRFLGGRLKKSLVPESEKAQAVIAILLALLTAIILIFAFWDVYYGARDHPPISAFKAIVIGSIPSLLAVLTVYVVVDRLREYGLDQTHARLDRIYRYLNDHVKTLQAEIMIVDRMQDVPWRNLFATRGPVGILANFAPLALIQGKTSLRNSFSSTRSGHVIVLADPTNVQLLDNIAKSRERMKFANTSASVDRAIRDSLAHLMEAVPDGIAQVSDRPIPGISILLSSRMLGYTSYWTEEAVFLCGLQAIEDADCTVPRILMYGDSGVAARIYGKDAIQRLEATSRRPSIDELLDLCAPVRDEQWVSRMKARLQI